MAVLAAALAGWCAPAGHPALSRIQAGTGARRRVMPRDLSAAVGGVLLVALAAAVAGPVSALFAGFLVVVVRWRVRVRRRLRAEARRRSRAADACRVLCVTLRAGRDPAEALSAAAGEAPELDAASRVASAGGDVVAALRDVARLPGGEGWAAVAAAWLVSERTGASLADAVDRVVGVLRDRVVVAHEAETELAAVRATAGVLAVLPVLPLLLGVGLGGEPVDFLLRTSWGAACLGVGGLLSLAGLWWIDRMAAGASAASAP
jgi:tight adherence protein B